MSPTKRVTRTPIDPARVLRSVADPSAGGVVIFLGTVRNRSEGKEVVGLEYDVYRAMAEARMRGIELDVRRKWPVTKVSMVHRYGKLDVGEVSVAVAVSSEHRAEAFAACRYAIDAIKTTLPLWKKERLKSGREEWVKGNPISG